MVKDLDDTKKRRDRVAAAAEGEEQASHEKTTDGELLERISVANIST